MKAQNKSAAATPRFPISKDELARFIDNLAGDLESHTDLSNHGDGSPAAILAAWTIGRATWVEEHTYSPTNTSGFRDGTAKGHFADLEKVAATLARLLAMQDGNGPEVHHVATFTRQQADRLTRAAKFVGVPVEKLVVGAALGRLDGWGTSRGDAREALREDVEFYANERVSYAQPADGTDLADGVQHSDNGPSVAAAVA